MIFGWSATSLALALIACGPAAAAPAAAAAGSLAPRRAGWLDRVVAFHRGQFLDELRNASFVHIQAKIVDAPPGYKPSGNWTYEQVVRLLTLLRVSPHTQHVVRALRRALAPRLGRRFMMNRVDSYKWFPSIDPDNYYDDDYKMPSKEEVDPRQKQQVHDDSVIFIINPVEAKVPAQITVRELNKILIERAKRNRQAPEVAVASFTMPPAWHS